MGQDWAVLNLFISSMINTRKGEALENAELRTEILPAMLEDGNLRTGYSHCCAGKWELGEGILPAVLENAELGVGILTVVLEDGHLGACAPPMV